MKSILLRVVILWAILRRSSTQPSVPATAINCCEGDILLLLDSSGSVANYEFSRFLLFAAELLRPFSLGRDHVRVGLLQVGTKPNLEFGLDVHTNQESLQRALQRVIQLQGDTNTDVALRVAQQLLRKDTQGDVPKILLWLTDGAQPGDVDELMSALKEQGVYVLAVSTVHGNYQVLQRVVTPPLESHLYSVDIENIEIITEDLREAIIEIIRAERLRVVNLTSRSAVLQWRPVLSSDSGYYVLNYRSALGTDLGMKHILSGDSSWTELINLEPETPYTASLSPESNQRLFNTLSVSFTTLPDVLSPAEVSLSDSGPHQIRVSWGPLQPAQVQRYTVEYGAIPSGSVHTLMFNSQQNSTLLTSLEPSTDYLVTVSALHASGKEIVMSVKACTQEAAALPALADLQLRSVDLQGVEVAWRANHEGLKGFWLSWEREKRHSIYAKPSISSVYLPPTSRGMHLTHLAPSSRVCVSPVYSSGRGDGICCSAHTHADSRQSG
ncbi:von Willebrand factor A domain-containing protein 1-like [Halichoeres trimaculatus]|uniref:von Willebrand factor A domain-containing protein 1-like n=1 Tax=Halichoeres trimaculatus TaxID=147232 RepID=UPI003D9E681C